MSSSINDRDDLYKPPTAERVVTFNWDDDLPAGAAITQSSWAVSPEGGVTVDNPSIAADGRSVSARVKGGTAGVDYVLTNTVVTNTNPTETEPAWITVKVRA